MMFDVCSSMHCKSSLDIVNIITFISDCERLVCVCKLGVQELTNEPCVVDCWRTARHSRRSAGLRCLVHSPGHSSSPVEQDSLTVRLPMGPCH
jgi:hypothetical protein